VAQKLGWITLKALLKGVQLYITRNDQRLHASLTTEQYDCVVALLNAIIVCINILPLGTPDP
jgi:predicted ATP-dependent protease